MPLHPEIAKVIASLCEHPEGPLDPLAMRAADEAMVVPIEDRLPLHNVEDAAVPSGAGGSADADLHGRR